MRVSPKHVSNLFLHPLAAATRVVIIHCTLRCKQTNDLGTNRVGVTSLSSTVQILGGEA